MTKAQLEARVRYWQRALEPLGLLHWRINVDIAKDEPRGRPNSRAAITTSSHYDTAWLEYHPESLSEDSAQEIDETIIHELLHVVFRGTEQVTRAATEWMPPHVESMWDEELEHEREKVIERLARTIYALHKG